MSKKLIGYALFFVVLVAAFYVFLFKGNDNWKHKLPVISYVKPFHFTTQDGGEDLPLLGISHLLKERFNRSHDLSPLYL